MRVSLDLLDTHEGTARLEAFSDAIFAIAATLLVIDIKVPPGLNDPAQLIAALGELWPNYASYAASFIYLGVYWSHHFHLFTLFQRTDHIFFKINVLFLMMISFLPFPTALLAEYLRAPGEMRRIAVLVYSGSLFMTAVLFFIIWLYATYRRRLVDPNLDEDLIRDNTRRYRLAPIGYGIAFALAFMWPLTGLAIALLVSLYYIIPTQVITYD